MGPAIKEQWKVSREMIYRMKRTSAIRRSAIAVVLAAASVGGAIVSLPPAYAASSQRAGGTAGTASAARTGAASIPGAGLTTTTVARNADGRMEMFAVDGHHRVWYRSQTTAGANRWTDYAPFSGTLTSIAAETNGQGRIEVFGVDDSAKVYHRWQLAPNSDSWSAWVEFGGALSSAPSAISVVRSGSHGPLQVFGVDDSGKIFGRTQFDVAAGSSQGRWSGWVPIDGTLSEITAETNGNGAVELFGVDGAGKVYHRWETAPGTGQWSSWVDFGGSLPLPSTIAATTSGSGQLDVMATSNGQIFGRSQFSLPAGGDGGRWSDWGTIDGSLSQVAVDGNSDGRIELTGVDGSGANYVRQQTAPNGGNWTAWQTLSAPVPAPSTVSITTSSTVEQFVDAVTTPNTTVQIAGDVNLDLSGTDPIPMAAGVKLIGDRSVNARGPRIFTTTFQRTLLSIGDNTDDVRISGIRFDGGEPNDPGASVGKSGADGVDISSSQHLEIDHDEFARFRGAAISAADPGNRMNRDNADTLWIHDDYIHDNQHPTMNGVEDVFGDRHGAGYGVELSKGAYALIEKSVFEANRHSVTGDGRPGTGYLVYRNLFQSPGLGFSLLGWDHFEHLIDMHGQGDGCSNYECGPAGEYADVAYNAFPSTSSTEIKLRGTPSDSFNVENNVFAHTVRWASLVTDGALDQTETGLKDNGGNYLGATLDHQTPCDFDGDGVKDPFMTTGETWWYATSAGDQRWVYLNQSNERAADLRFRDVNGDGRCDLTSVNDGKVYLTPSPLG